MKVLVVHASHFGSTRQIAERMTNVLVGHGLEVTVEAADQAGAASAFDAVVIGSAVHGGHWLKAASEFVRRERSTLRQRPVWLFSSGPVGDLPVRSVQSDPAEIGEFRHYFTPQEHRVLAGSFDRATADFGGLGIVERTVVKRFLPEGDWRDWPAIEAWAAGIARQLTGRRELAREPVAAAR